MDNLSAMEVFVRVVQAGSFSAAARDLALTPSAVSKQIGRLEDRLGARLLNRTTRQLSLTEVGRGYFERAGQILADVAEAEQAVADQDGAPRGLLRVSLPFAFGQRWYAIEGPAAPRDAGPPAEISFAPPPAQATGCFGSVGTLGWRAEYRKQCGRFTHFQAVFTDCDGEWLLVKN